jgi:prepilin-type N-terminal cleavage/methylation domain-containing protein
MKKINKNKPGFTIIEVVLVLAIAGLIFMMVFIAYPALRRSQRDTQRQHDVSRLVTAIQSYMSSHNGKMPDSVYDGRTYVYGHTKIAYSETKPSSNSWHDFYDRYLLVGDGTSNDSFEDPDGSPYSLWVTSCGKDGDPKTADGRCNFQGSVRDRYTFKQQSEGTMDGEPKELNADQSGANPGDLSRGHTISIVRYATCGEENTYYATGKQSIAVIYKKEGGGVICQSM